MIRTEKNKLVSYDIVQQGKKRFFSNQDNH